MERECRRCRQTTTEFRRVADPEFGTLLDSVCRACRAVEPTPKRPKATPKLANAPQPLAKPFRKVPTREAREALKAYRLGDVASPVALITGPCHFTGVGPAMCLDLLDRKRPADDGNVVPCGFYVRAARGALSPGRFVQLCASVAHGVEQTAAQARESLSMSARYDAAGGRVFKDMCRAVAEHAKAQSTFSP